MTEVWPQFRTGTKIISARPIEVGGVPGLGTKATLPAGTAGRVFSIRRPGNNFGFEPFIGVRWQAPGNYSGYYRPEDLEVIKEAR